MYTDVYNINLKYTLWYIEYIQYTPTYAPPFSSENALFPKTSPENAQSENIHAKIHAIRSINDSIWYTEVDRDRENTNVPPVIQSYHNDVVPACRSSKTGFSPAHLKYHTVYFLTHTCILSALLGTLLNPPKSLYTVIHLYTNLLVLPIDQKI